MMIDLSSTAARSSVVCPHTPLSIIFRQLLSLSLVHTMSSSIRAEYLEQLYSVISGCKNRQLRECVVLAILQTAIYVFIFTS